MMSKEARAFFLGGDASAGLLKWKVCLAQHSCKRMRVQYCHTRHGLYPAFLVRSSHQSGGMDSREPAIAGRMDLPCMQAVLVSSTDIVEGSCIVWRLVWSS